MHTYTFYPLLTGGTCLSFTAMGLADDAAAMGYAALVLAEHPSAFEVVVWQGDRRVGSHVRPGLAPTDGGPYKSRILVIEDSYFQAEDLKCAFHDAGYGDVSCSVAAEAAIACLLAEKPDLAIVDIDLGEGPSFEVAEALEQSGVPFLFFTAFDRATLPPRWQHVGHMIKPVPARQVVRVSHALLTGLNG